MRFHSQYPNKNYVVPGHAKDYAYQGNFRRVKRGLSAQFHLGVFDSEEAARQNQWSAKDRKIVENYLRDPEACLDTRLGLIVEEGAIPDPATLAGNRTRCIAMKVGTAGPEPCGLAVFPGTDYCKPHLLELVEPEGSDLVGAGAKD